MKPPARVRRGPRSDGHRDMLRRMLESRVFVANGTIRRGRKDYAHTATEAAFPPAGICDGAWRRPTSHGGSCQTGRKPLRRIGRR
ncbi:MAG: hypothetical protein HN572_00835, partial [Kordiimonadaceae bacterium]|nr:hypothetical protein [Kordiimonadaceae bacterium]